MCDICHYWYFLDERFKFQTYVCNISHDLLTMSINLNDIAILDINSVDYCCIFRGVTKFKAVNLLQNADLNQKNGAL